MANYPYAQWFDPAPSCRVCGKPAGALKSYGNNQTLGYFCKAHADREIAAAHRKKQWLPDVVLAEREELRP